MNQDEDFITLPSGREIGANRRIIGIDDRGAVFEGYDGGVDSPEGRGLTDAQRIELADIMIARWTEFKRRAEGGE